MHLSERLQRFVRLRINHGYIGVFLFCLTKKKTTSKPLNLCDLVHDNVLDTELLFYSFKNTHHSLLSIFGIDVSSLCFAVQKDAEPGAEPPV